MTQTVASRNTPSNVSQMRLPESDAGNSNVRRYQPMLFCGKPGPTGFEAMAAIGVLVERQFNRQSCGQVEDAPGVVVELFPPPGPWLSPAFGEIQCVRPVVAEMEFPVRIKREMLRAVNLLQRRKRLKSRWPECGGQKLVDEPGGIHGGEDWERDAEGNAKPVQSVSFITLDAGPGRVAGRGL